MDTMWYYALRGQERQGPVTEADLRGLIAAGTVGPGDLVWCEGMPSWQAVRDVPALAPSAASIPAPQPVPTPVATPRPVAGSSRAAASSAAIPPGLLGWTSFVGVMNILGGVLSCLSCFGILYGIFMIIAGTALMGAKSALQGVQTIDPAMQPFLAKLKTAMQMMGIFYILTIVVTIIMVIVYAGMIFGALSSGTFSLPTD